ncbi:DivIVA domain-containing protein [Granulicoccus sp. GXG6511]|uniref:DivIVA domain-containing protein n=1 Tax=Granulicoccus sp. GXG6511 TaxID=3381351 RepID=UPI003D7D4C84
MTLTLDEVRKTKFHMARRTGYEVSEVDLFVDRVEASFAQLTEENQMLKQQVEALKQAQTQSRQREDRQEPSNAEVQAQQQRQPEPPRPQPQQQPQQPQQVARAAGGTEKLVVTTSAEASPAVVRLVQMATEQSEQLVNEANSEAKRKIEEANQKANQITTDARTKSERLESEARTKSERLESEARTNAERMTNEAQGRANDLDRQVGLRRAELFSALEEERDQLQDAVGQLRSFEANYRQSFASHLKQQLQSVESISFEPSQKPALADGQGNTDGRRARQGSEGGQSGTPRLDALLGENQRNS